MQAVYLVQQSDDRRLADALEHAGYHVIAVNDAEMAAAVLEAIRPQAFVIDASNPAVRGARLLEKLRGEHRYRDVPVLLIGTQSGEYRELSADGGLGAVLLEDDPFHVLGRLDHLCRGAGG